MRSSSPLTVLRHRSFATFWSAAVVSDIGTWMQAITVGVLVAHTTGKATATGLIGIAANTPPIGDPIPWVAKAAIPMSPVAVALPVVWATSTPTVMACIQVPMSDTTAADQKVANER